MTPLSSSLVREMFPQVDRVAIIGNGPLFHEDLGEVTQCQMVVRFNNWGSRRECLPYHKRMPDPRCDMVFGNDDVFTTNIWKPPYQWEVPRLYVHAAFGELRSSGASARVKKFYPHCTEAIISQEMHKVHRETLRIQPDWNSRPMPTVGMHALQFFYRYAHSAQRFYLCGFTWWADTAAKTIQGRCPSMPPVGGWNHIHFREARWASQHLLPDAHWKFSAEAQRVLEWVHDLPKYEHEDKLILTA